MCSLPGATATVFAAALPVAAGRAPSLRRNSRMSSARLVSACRVTVATDRYHTSMREKCGCRESSTTGTTKVSRRDAELKSEGQVLPSAWNTPEQLKMSPVAMKFQEMMRRYGAPTATLRARG